MKLSNLFDSFFMKLIESISAVFLSGRNITIVTGSDSSHFHSMLQLINSIKITNGNKANIICYDLGLVDHEIQKFTELFPEITLKRFDYTRYPPYYNIKVNAGEYAWKSAIIKEEYDQVGPNDFIVWLDAGCFVIKKLNIVKLNLILFGIVSPSLSGSIIELTHEHTIATMGLKQNSHLPMLSAGFVGLKKTTKNTALIKEWYNFCSQKDVIAPVGSSRLNHRQDQSVLSLLFYNYYEINFLNRLLKPWEVHVHKDIG